MPEMLMGISDVQPKCLALPLAAGAFLLPLAAGVV